MWALQMRISSFSPCPNSIPGIGVAFPLFVLRKPAFVLHMTEFATSAAVILAKIIGIFGTATISITALTLITGHTKHVCAMMRYLVVFSCFVKIILLLDHRNELKRSHEVFHFAHYVWRGEFVPGGR